MTATTHPDVLVDAILKQNELKSGEEDFWAIAVMITKGKRPIFAMNGPLLAIAEHTARLIGANQINTNGEQFQILTFQGEKAQWAIDAMAKAPGLTSLNFAGDIRRIFPTMAPTTTTIILDEEYVTS